MVRHENTRQHGNRKSADQEGRNGLGIQPREFSDRRSQLSRVLKIQLEYLRNLGGSRRGRHIHQTEREKHMPRTVCSRLSKYVWCYMQKSAEGVVSVEGE
jgi:hypothetical protein